MTLEKRVDKWCALISKHSALEDLMGDSLLSNEYIFDICIKLNTFCWRLLLNRLPNKDNILYRGIDVPSSVCPICNHVVEEVNHVFWSVK